MKHYALDNVLLNWPEAKLWMWNYCIYLGPYVDFRGDKYDLGIYIGPHETHPSAAIVYADSEGSYLSGSLNQTVRNSSDVYRETYERAKALRLMR